MSQRPLYPYVAAGSLLEGLDPGVPSYALLAGAAQPACSTGLLCVAQNQPYRTGAGVSVDGVDQGADDQAGLLDRARCLERA